jgi:NAD(P)H-nitrite reductase large subunit
MKYLIIGNSAAAIGCVEGIRKVDPDSPITLIASEPHHTYSRPLISYLLCGKTDEQRMKYRPDSFYADHGVEALLGETVTGIDPAQKSVTLAGGRTVSYDKLMIATGSRPFVPPIEGIEQVERKFSFMTLDDAHALDAALTKESRVLIMGAGLIGLKCAEGIADKAGSITVVDMADHILPSILEKEPAALVQKHIESHSNIRFILGDAAARFTARSAVLKSGAEVPFDVLCVCVGVRPNTELAVKAGIAVGRGITVDEKSATSLPDIYAGGDCTECHDITTGSTRILALLPNAYLQGETAGINMAGGEKIYDNAIPLNAIGFFGLHMLTAGSYDGEVSVESDGENYRLFAVKDDTLHGFILIGNVDRAGIYTALIREQRPLSTLDFALIREKPQLIAFAKNDREKMLAQPH